MVVHRFTFCLSLQGKINDLLFLYCSPLFGFCSILFVFEGSVISNKDIQFFNIWNLNWRSYYLSRNTKISKVSWAQFGWKFEVPRSRMNLWIHFRQGTRESMILTTQLCLIAVDWALHSPRKCENPGLLYKCFQNPVIPKLLQQKQASRACLRVCVTLCIWYSTYSALVLSPIFCR